MYIYPEDDLCLIYLCFPHWSRTATASQTQFLHCLRLLRKLNELLSLYQTFSIHKFIKFFLLLGIQLDMGLARTVIVENYVFVIKNIFNIFTNKTKIKLIIFTFIPQQVNENILAYFSSTWKSTFLYNLINVLPCLGFFSVSDVRYRSHGDRTQI